MEYIIIDLKTNKALYGLSGKTIKFSTEKAANEFGKQICLNYIVVEIKY
jgi:hypothetical protein